MNNADAIVNVKQCQFDSVRYYSKQIYEKISLLSGSNITYGYNDKQSSTVFTVADLNGFIRKSKRYERIWTKFSESLEY